MKVLAGLLMGGLATLLIFGAATGAFNPRLIDTVQPIDVGPERTDDSMFINRNDDDPLTEIADDGDDDDLDDSDDTDTSSWSTPSATARPASDPAARPAAPAGQDTDDSASVDSASVDSASVDSASVDSASVDSASVDSFDSLDSDDSD